MAHRVFVYVYICLDITPAAYAIFYYNSCNSFIVTSTRFIRRSKISIVGLGICLMQTLRIQSITMI